MRSKTKSSPTSENKTKRSRTTSKRKRATAGDQDLLFSQASFKTLEEIKFGDKGTHLRLVETENGKRYIQCWSGLSKQWNNMHMYNVNEQWSKWKHTYASIHSEGSQERRALRRDVLLGRTTDNPKRTTRRKTRTKSTEDRKQPNGKSGHESSRRVQGSTKKN